MKEKQPLLEKENMVLVRGGEVNTERCAIMLVDEFRACKWGRISLERPPQRVPDWRKRLPRQI